MAANDKDDALEKQVQKSHGPREVHQGNASEAQRLALKHDKDLNRSSPEGQPDMTGGKQPETKED